MVDNDNVTLHHLHHHHQMKNNNSKNNSTERSTHNDNSIQMVNHAVYSLLSSIN